MLNTGRANLGLAALEGYVFAIGGYDGETEDVLSSVERYDPASDSWVEVAPLNIARDALGAAMTGGKIYAIGGTGNPWAPSPAVGNENEPYGHGEPLRIYLPIILKQQP